MWATLLALQDGGEITVGVVSRAGARVAAGGRPRGAGAFVDDGLSEAPRRMHVSAVRELGDAQLCFPGLERLGATGSTG